ncbi:MAG TPA: 4-alpha-glucanotransferase [Verrucomicrobiae bacterium]
MRLILQVRFHTRPGQSLWVTGEHEFFGAGDFSNAIPLQYWDEQSWGTTIYVPRAAAPAEDLGYRYVLREPDGSVTEDRENGRSVNLAKHEVDVLQVIDSWNHPGFYENAFCTAPFRRVLLAPSETEVGTNGAASRTHSVRVRAPLVTKGQTLCLIGDTPGLGNWVTTNPLLLRRMPGQGAFTADLDLRGSIFPIAYKYGVYDTEQRQFIRYEDGSNRILHDTLAPDKLTIVNDGFAVLPADTWKGAGISIPVFSLRTNRSFGVGEFSDLKLLADWCQQTGLKLIQVLPVNDTTATHTWTDSYPYAAISAFALHPIYISLTEVAERVNHGIVSELEEERKRLNNLQAIDYEAVAAAKTRCLERLYPLQKERTFKSRGFRQFFQQNKKWLVPYAVFSHLRDQYGTADFTKWPAHRECAESDVTKLASEDSETCDSVRFHFFVQYHLHRQLADAVRYAHQRGVILKGDIPIGVHRTGSDAWQRPDLYHMDMQAGAPPDAFAAKGQNWGFPTYNWPKMKATGYAWWKQRFEQLGRYFDAFRIDHILGFFRIWSVPVHAVEGIMGHFVPALPVFRDELAARGIVFDYQRYARPFITDALLAEMFGPGSDSVKSQFLDRRFNGDYSLKPGFETQQQVARHFESATGEESARIRQGLFDLISNVILFDAEGSSGQAFHIRFAVESTSSFRNLDLEAQRIIKELYTDYFFRRQEEFWRERALEKLPPLTRATDLLICGEDLGLVPACVPEVMRRLGLLSLEVQRMPKEMAREFSRPAEAPYLSVVTPSTHDMSTIRGWWTEDRKITERFYSLELGKAGAAPASCEPWIVEEVIRQHLASPAMWSIFQVQDVLGIDAELRHPDPASERINVPANPRNYWSYRMHLPLESLIYAIKFNRRLRQLISESGR